MTNFPWSGDDPTPNEALLNEWATWMSAQSWSETTIKERVILIRRVSRESGCAPEAMTKSHLLAFLSQKTFKDSTRQKYYRDLKAWFSWVVDEEELRDDNPMAKVRKPVAGRQAHRALRTAHVTHLINSRMHARTRTMILLMAYQGLRAFEVAKFRGADIDLVSKELEVVGKGGVLSILPLHPIIEAEAARYGSGWWFPGRMYGSGEDRTTEHIVGGSVTRGVGLAMERAGVPGTGHSLRHWHATTLLAEGLDSRITQELMRHASLETTQRYMHVDDTQRRAGLMLLPDVTSRTESPSTSIVGVMPPSGGLDVAA